MEQRDESKIPTKPNRIVPRSPQPEEHAGPAPHQPTRPTRPVSAARVVAQPHPAPGGEPTAHTADSAPAPAADAPDDASTTPADIPDDSAPAEADSPEAGPDTPAARQPLRIGRYTVVGWHVAVVVAVLLAPVVATLGQLLPWGSLWLWLLRVLLLGVLGYTGYRAWHTYPSDPPEPKRRPLPEPSPEAVELERPAEPPQEIVEPALYCRICGKPLEERQDQELGVDNACYVQHGAKREYQPNPAHAQWQEDMRRLQARETDEQALADARHARELEDWKAARQRGAELWTREREQWHLDCARQETFRHTLEGRRLIARAHTWGAAAAGALGLFILSWF